MKKFSVQGFYDESTSTVSYLVFDPATRDAILIDPVLDYDPSSATVSCHHLERVISFIHQEKLTPHLCLETHAHADHLSGAQEFKKNFPQVKVAIGRRITEVQSFFKKFLNVESSFVADGTQFDHLLKGGERFVAGSIEVEVIETPGHTPACSSYLIGDALFTGDALFMPDTGTGRCDFPGGNSRDLYHSVHEKLYKLPDAVRVFVGHDYKAGGSREPRWQTSLSEQKTQNIQLKDTTSEEDYVKARDARDATLSEPRLLVPSMQVNIRAGHLPRLFSKTT